MMRGMLAAGLVTMLCGAAVQAGDMKVGTLDMEMIIKACPDTQNAEDLLDRMIASLEQQQKDSIDKMEKIKIEIDELRKAAQNKALKDGEREDKQKLVEVKIDEARKFERDASEAISRQKKAINEQGSRLRKLIVARIRDVVKDYAVKNGFTLVLDSAGVSVTGVDAILYSSPDLDITPDVLKIVSAMKPSAADLAPTDTARDGASKP